jgi:diguanylate cyclase (GGDEF)-like protein/PAS domain S-box-containing protein
MQEKSLRQKLLIIVSMIIVLPYLVLCFIFYDQGVSLSPIHFLLFLLILALSVIGIIFVRYVFEAISSTAESLKKVTEGGNTLSLNLRENVVELNEISKYFNHLVERLTQETQLVHETSKALRKSNDTYSNIIENIEEGYYEVNLAGDFTFFNTSMAQILGYSREELKGMNNRQYMDCENANKAFISYRKAYQTGKPINNLEGELLRKDGKKVSAETSVSLIWDSSGQVVGFRGIVRDITERKKMEEVIYALSITDELTGLHNRRGFKTLAEQQVKIKERTNHRLLMLFADLDNTKCINDRSGHETGDKAIVEVAAILSEVFRKSDIIARIGGDEFAVLGIEYTTQDFGILEGRLQNQIDLHNAMENKEYQISLSVGMVCGDPEHPYSIDELMSRADALMYEQKRIKRSTGAPFS